ncbi:MAG: ABC transporter ATP-binding protein [Spirulina sp. SIO3F2]|nr:ABC transporter ATP-binding protein [Spirulina sp. SIO3F2]
MAAAHRLLIHFALRYPFLIVLTIILGFSGALFNGISTALIVPLLLGFLGQDTGLLDEGPPALQKVMQFFDQFSGDWKFIAMIGTVVGALMLKNLAMYLTVVVATHLSRRLVNGIRTEGIELLLNLDLAYFAKQKVGNLVNIVNYEVGRTASAIRIGISMFTTVVTITVFVGLLVILSWQLTLVTVGLLSVIVGINQWFVRRARHYGRTLSQKSKDYSNKLLEILTGIRLIKTVSYEEHEYQNIVRFIQEREQAEFLSQVNYAAIPPFNELSGILTLLGIVVIGRMLFADQVQALSTILLTYLAVLTRLLPLVSRLNGERSRFANNAISAGVTAAFLDPRDKPRMQVGAETELELKTQVCFKDVSFAYPGQKENVLHHIDLTVPKGKTLALVGASGAGKSTLVDLVPRFYDPTSGQITIDELDIREFTLPTLRGQLGVVSQDTFLFNNTIRFNLTYGLSDVTETELEDAIRRANAHEFIKQLPAGLETEIGDRGVMLSGGQRQRLAIARALLRNPSILILDEATSALDTVSERLVQGAIDELCRDRTTLVIAHRLSTIQQADQIVVLDQGRVVEVGTHQELLHKNGQYAKLHNMQFGSTRGPKVVLPTNAALIRASIRASHELRTRLSYEVRSRLNALLGLLQLLADDLVDTPEERQELIAESYDAAMTLLNTLSFFEERGARLPKESPAERKAAVLNAAQQY